MMPGHEPSRSAHNQDMRHITTLLTVTVGILVTIALWIVLDPPRGGADGRTVIGVALAAVALATWWRFETRAVDSTSPEDTQEVLAR